MSSQIYMSPKNVDPNIFVFAFGPENPFCHTPTLTLTIKITESTWHTSTLAISILKIWFDSVSKTLANGHLDHDKVWKTLGLTISIMKTSRMLVSPISTSLPSMSPTLTSLWKEICEKIGLSVTDSQSQLQRNWTESVVRNNPPPPPLLHNS